MGRGLSSLQKDILLQGLEDYSRGARERNCLDIDNRLVLKKHFGWDWVNYRMLPPKGEKASYRVAHAAISRAMRRLEKRALIQREIKGGANLTAEGLRVAVALSGVPEPT